MPSHWKRPIRLVSWIADSRKVGHRRSSAVIVVSDTFTGRSWRSSHGPAPALRTACSSSGVAPYVVRRTRCSTGSDVAASATGAVAMPAAPSAPAPSRPAPMPSRPRRDRFVAAAWSSVVEEATRACRQEEVIFSSIGPTGQALLDLELAKPGAGR